MIQLIPRIALALLLLPLTAAATPQDTAAELPAHAPAPAAQEQSAAPRRPGETTTGRPPASARPAPVTAPAAQAPPTAALPGDAAVPAPTATDPAPAAAPAAAPVIAPLPPVTSGPARQAPQVTMPTTSGPGAGGLLQTIFALLLVLGLLAGLAWFMKRYGPKVTGASANLRVVGALNIGGRERIMVVEVGDKWIVLGAAPGRVNALHTMARPDGEAAILPAEGGAPAGNFADWLKKTIDNRGLKRNAN